ncbi:hypothetical protein RsoM2USA_255 [Ralstonia phage RsoM2USA]|nr:hypothetical protein RsoM2USA_255 [Ralstonia phage RsoM2USA]
MNQTFKQFLTETPVVDVDDMNKLSAISKLIKRDCQEYLRDSQSGNFLYRGIRAEFNDEFGDMHRFAAAKNRIPTDSPQWLHDLWNEIIEDKTGIKGARDRAVFTTNQREQAMEYAGNSGSLYIVFPIGPYDMLWDEDVYDSFIHVEAVWNRLMKQNSQIQQVPLQAAQNILDPDEFEYMVSELKNVLEQHYDESSNPFHGKHEIYLLTDEYYAINAGKNRRFSSKESSFIHQLKIELWGMP